MYAQLPLTPAECSAPPVPTSATVVQTSSAWNAILPTPSTILPVCSSAPLLTSEMPPIVSLVRLSVLSTASTALTIISVSNAMVATSYLTTCATLTARQATWSLSPSLSAISSSLPRKLTTSLSPSSSLL